MKNSILIAALLAATVVFTALYATAAAPLAGSGLAVEDPAGDGPADYERGRGMHFARLAEALELTPEQQEQIKAIRATEQEKMAPLRQQLHEGRERIRAAIESQPFDEAGVRAMAAEQAEIRTELIVTKARMKSRIHSLLTPEQREKAEKMRFFMEEERGHKGHYKGHHRQPS